jgi:hypothetical protein
MFLARRNRPRIKRKTNARLTSFGSSISRPNSVVLMHTCRRSSCTSRRKPPWPTTRTAPRIRRPRSPPCSLSATARRQSSSTKPRSGPANHSAEFWLADESPEHLNFSPESLGGGSVRMAMVVDDPDAAFDRAVKAGATIVWPVHNEYGWRLGRIVDPFGHHWEIGKPLPSAS